MFHASLRDAGLGATSDPSVVRARLAVLDDVCDHFLARYRAARPISPPRVALWEGLDLLTYVLHCWTKLKPARLVPRMAMLEHHRGPILGVDVPAVGGDHVLGVGDSVDDQHPVLAVQTVGRPEVHELGHVEVAAVEGELLEPVEVVPVADEGEVLSAVAPHLPEQERRRQLA